MNLKDGQPERALDHQVVERHEAHLRRQVRRVGEQLLVGLHECLVEDVPERVRHLLAGALDVGRDELRLGDHLVAKARVELHVARLVDLLGREKGGLLLRPVGRDETGELGRDALLGDHQ